MILGHYASAYIAKPHVKTAPLWLLLLCSNLAEFLWLFLALVGVEPTKPNSILDATFSNLEVAMTFSHNLIPNLTLGLAVFSFVKYFYRKKENATLIAFWCGLLSCLHVWCDFIVGFEHQLFGPTSASVGLNSYGRFPYLAIMIELLFAIACLMYYFLRQNKLGDPVSKKKKIQLIVAFTVGILMWMPNATMSMREVFGL